MGRKRGPKKAKSSTQLENEKLRSENERLRKKLAHAEKIIDVPKKALRGAGESSFARVVFD